MAKKKKKALTCDCIRCELNRKNTQKACKDIVKKFKKNGDFEELKFSIYKQIMAALDCCE